ncbi:MAG: hypothetical protein LBR11_03800 [Deltaproteobacteria bacterium]|nr:hypothetical protein [Deltaproteobacteria bacterium]
MTHQLQLDHPSTMTERPHHNPTPRTWPRPTSRALHRDIIPQFGSRELTGAGERPGPALDFLTPEVDLNSLSLKINVSRKTGPGSLDAPTTLRNNSPSLIASPPQNGPAQAASLGRNGSQPLMVKNKALKPIPQVSMAQNLTICQ